MRRYSIVGAVVAIALLLLSWIALRKPESFEPQHVTLPGESTLELYHVTWGTNHHRVVGSLGARLALRMPRPIRTALRLRTAAVEDAGNTKTPVLLLWFRESSNTIQPQELTLTAVGDSGEEIVLNPSYHNWLGSSGSSKSQTFWPAVNVFPWRSSRFKVRLYREAWGGPSAPERLAEFTIPNPRSGRTPRWQPETIPVTRTNSPLEVTLASWHPALQLDPARDLTADRRDFWNRTRLSIRENGQPAPYWYVAQVIWQDAIGNRATDGHRWAGITAGEDLLELGMRPQLSTNESALKLTLCFARDARAAFAPDERWEIRGVRVPGTNELVEPALTNFLQGAQVVLDCLSGPRTRDGPILRRAGRRLVVRCEAPAEAIHVLVLGMTDDRGRQLPPPKEWSQSASEIEFGVNWPPDAATVDLTLAVERLRWVEFSVPPYPAPPK